MLNIDSMPKQIHIYYIITMRQVYNKEWINPEETINDIPELIPTYTMVMMLYTGNILSQFPSNYLKVDKPTQAFDYFIGR